MPRLHGNLRPPRNYPILLSPLPNSPPPPPFAWPRARHQPSSRVKGAFPFSPRDGWRELEKHEEEKGFRRARAEIIGLPPSRSLVARFVGNEARWWRQTELKLYNQPTYLPTEIYTRDAPFLALPRISRPVMPGSGVGVIGTQGSLPRFNPLSLSLPSLRARSSRYRPGGGTFSSRVEEGG